MADQAYVADALIGEDIEAYLVQHQQKSLLRFITCGSVDDGKSTLIGRMLYDSRMIFEDQLAALEADSRRIGTQGDAIDFALLVDGLSAEREQGITIDVAYRFFTTEKRKFIVADCPGHEQYTRNMITGASTADLAILLVDARKGISVQTRRHAFLASLIGIRNIVLAVNKMDLIGYDRDRYEAICDAFRAFAGTAGIGDDFACIPISGLAGDNISVRSQHMPWYGGDTLIALLEEVPLHSARDAALPFCMPVQWVNRPHLDFRGFAGTIAEGSLAQGDPVQVLPGGRTSRVTRIVSHDGDLDRAVAGQAVTLCLADEIECARGSMIAAADAAPQMAEKLSTHLVWMDEAPLVPRRAYWLKIGTQLVTATVQPPDYAINVNTMEQLAVPTLALNAIGVVDIVTDRPIIFAPYAESRALGGFILIDKITNRTVAAGMVRHALAPARNVHWQATDITREAHARQKGQSPRLLWFTGLSGSGKSTIANLVEQRLFALGRHSFLLDGDNVRHGLCRDLGFSSEDRTENIRRIGEVARLMLDAGLIVLSAFISPFRADRDMVRAMLPPGEFIEIFVDTPLEVAEARDPKGLYKRARAGEIADFTGIESPYEAPLRPDIHIDTTRMSAAEAADMIVEHVIGVWSPDL